MKEDWFERLFANGAKREREMIQLDLKPTKSQRKIVGLATLMVNFVKGRIEEVGEISPMIHIELPNDNYALVGLGQLFQDGMEDLKSEIIKKLLREKKAIGYCLVSEVWVRSATNLDSIPRNLSEDPLAFSAVMITAENINGDAFFGAWKIHGTDKKWIEIDASYELYLNSPGNKDRFKGRMLDLLK